jgi:hypothetical protein
MHAPIESLPTTTSHIFARGRRAASFLSMALTSLVLAACDAEPDELPLDDADVLVEGEEEGELVPPEKMAPDIDHLMKLPEAASLQTWLETQGYAMVSSDVELSDSSNAIVQFTKPGSAELIGAAIAFRLADSGEVLEVAAVIADEPDPSDPTDIDTCLSPAVYHANNGAIEITMAPQASGCQIGIFGCGRCLTTGHCTGERRESYFWGIKFNTCDPCEGVNPNGCCGCLPGHFC